MKLNIEIFRALADLKTRGNVLNALQETSDSDAYFYELLDSIEVESSGSQKSLVDTIMGCTLSAKLNGLLVIQ